MKKTIIFMILFIMLCVAIIGVSLMYDSIRLRNWLESAEIVEITIRYGDTLDGYWVKYAPKWMSRFEYRDLLIRINNLESYDLYAGQTILIIK